MDTLVSFRVADQYQLNMWAFVSSVAFRNLFMWF